MSSRQDTRGYLTNSGGNRFLKSRAGSPFSDKPAITHDETLVKNILYDFPNENKQAPRIPKRIAQNVKNLPKRSTLAPRRVKATRAPRRITEAPRKRARATTTRRAPQAFERATPATRAPRRTTSIKRKASSVPRRTFRRTTTRRPTTSQTTTSRPTSKRPRTQRTTTVRTTTTSRVTLEIGPVADIREILEDAIEDKEENFISVNFEDDEKENASGWVLPPSLMAVPAVPGAPVTNPRVAKDLDAGDGQEKDEEEAYLRFMPVPAVPGIGTQAPRRPKESLDAFDLGLNFSTASDHPKFKQCQSRCLQEFCVPLDGKPIYDKCLDKCETFCS